MADIGEKELAAVVIAVQTWRYRLSHRCVLIRSDNETVVNCINTRTSRANMMRWLRHMFVIILLDNINVRAVHTPGCANRAADALSRGSVQMFRRLRPAADSQPTVWSWPAFATRRRSARCLTPLWRHLPGARISGFTFNLQLFCSVTDSRCFRYQCLM